MCNTMSEMNTYHPCEPFTVTVNPLFVAWAREASPTIPDMNPHWDTTDDETKTDYVRYVMFGLSKLLTPDSTSHIMRDDPVMDDENDPAKPVVEPDLDQSVIVKDLNQAAFWESIPAYDLQKYPANPAFEACRLDTHTLHMVRSAYVVVSRRGAWKTLHDYIPDPERGFMYTNDRPILEIMRAIDDDDAIGHSGGSLVYTMRHIHYIAMFGFDGYQNMLMDSSSNSSG